MIDRETATDLFKSRMNASDVKGETRDCTVRALSIAGDVSYDTAHEALRLAGRKPKRGCHWDVQWKALTSLGFIAYDLTNHVDGKTTITLERELRRRFPDGRFLIGVRHHRLPMVGGRIIDHSQGRRFQIRSVYMIVKHDEPQPQGYEFERTRLVDAHETTNTPLVVEPPKKEVVSPKKVVSPTHSVPLKMSGNMVEAPIDDPTPLTQKPRSRMVRRMTTKIRATGAEHPITTARQAFGLSSNQLGKLIGAPGASLWRIERGLNVPRREVARDLSAFFQGALPLGAIYDGPYWLDITPGDERARVLGRLEVLGSQYRNNETAAA